MDASAYLRKQGWRGDGHSLDYTNRGIRKPLLISKKVDVLGVGLNKHRAVSDQWWLKAFDQGLKSLGTGEESVLASVQKHGVKRGALYARFVKGDDFAGSIGQSLPLSEDSEGTRISTPEKSHEEPEDLSPTITLPVEAPRKQATNMAVDIPPEDKLKRVVRSDVDQHQQDAMMHLLQNPDDVPASMRKLVSRKRKRAESAGEKRARWAIERKEKSKMESAEKRRRLTEDGTWDYEKEEEKRRMREINRRATDFVLEAQKRGIIPAGPNEIRKGLVPTMTGANATAVANGVGDDMQQVFNQAGLDSQVKLAGSGKNSLKAQKYAREKMKRELKRAAKAYLMGEEPPHEKSKEERMAKKASKRLQTAQKKADAAKKDAERMAMREERAAKKRETRARRKAEKAEITRIMEERDAAEKAGKTMDEYYAERAEREAAAANGEGASASEEGKGNEFESVADEVKFNMNSKGNAKKIPGKGIVDRYPTKAEKRAKKLKATAIREGVSEEEIRARIEAEKDQKDAVEREKIDRYRAMKHGVSLEEYKAALEQGEVHVPKVERKNLPPAKLAQYQERAARKGIKLEDYIKRREEKYAATQAEKLGNPFQQDILQAAIAGADYIAAVPDDLSVDAPPPDQVGFIVDTAGDTNLAMSVPSFIERAQATISKGKPLAIVDTDGNETLTWQPNMPVPLDPRIWEGKNVKDLPKAVRKARRDWMAAKREAKKASKTERDEKLPPKKSKGQRKVEAREAFVKQILFKSRQALRSGGVDGGMLTIDGISNVPLVTVKSTEGMYQKAEIALARTVARRVLRNVKREEKAKKGKGKGFKKRERAAKEAARNAGISGFTDKARFETGANPDLLL